MPEHLLYDDKGNEFFLPSTAESDDFDSDDFAEALSALESSQRCDPHLPHIPAELILYILLEIPPSYILPFRSVSRAFRDCIDTHVFYSYIKTTRLRHPFLSRLPFSDRSTTLHFSGNWEVKASFSHLKHKDEDDSVRNKAQRAKWEGTHAVFRLDPEWMKMFESFQAPTLNGTDRKLAQGLISSRELDVNLIRTNLGPDIDWRTWCSWILELDCAISDFILPALELSLTEGTVSFLWREMLLKLLREEGALRKKLEQTASGSYYRSHDEDCLRAIRRKRLRMSIDPELKDERKLDWAISFMQPLFGQPWRNIADDAQGLQHTEDWVMRDIVARRREAAMTPQEKVQLQQFVANRKTMLQERSEIQNRFLKWWTDTYSADMDWRSFSKENAPLTWDDRTQAAEHKRVEQWLANRSTADSILRVLDAADLISTIDDDVSSI